MSSEAIAILTTGLSLMTGILGYFLRYFLDRRKSLISEATKERREHYQKFVDLVIDLFSKVGKENKELGKEELKELYDFYKKYILYASPRVINSFSNYFQFLYSSNKEEGDINLKAHMGKLSSIMKNMRQDLGLSNKNLGKNGEKIFRALITDFDQILYKGKN